MTGWVQTVGRFRVEHVPCPHPNVPVSFTSGPARGVQHTTEGSLASALNEFRVKYAPHFLLGMDKGRVRVLQLIPLGFMAAALEHPAGTPATNGVVRAQIELADFAQHHPWLPMPAQVQEALGELYLALSLHASIPMRHIDNPRRDRQTFARYGGWYGHGDVPDQPSGHWDPGDLQYGLLFKKWSLGAKPKAPKPKPRPMVLQPRTYTLVRRANGLVYAENIERPT